MKSKKNLFHLGAAKNTAIMAAVPERICGRAFVTAKGMNPATVCSKYFLCVLTKHNKF